MRILQLGKYYYPYMGGIETHLKELCHALKRSHDVEVVVFNDRPELLRESAAGIDVTRVPSLGRFASTEISPALVSELSRREYDLVHLHTPNPMGMAAYLVARKPRAHQLVVTHHSDTVRQARLRKAFQPIFRKVMNRADAVVATSHRYLETSVELQPYKRKTVIIPYGIDGASFDTPTRSEVQAIRQKYGPRIVLAVGRLIYYKGFNVLLDAMTQIDGAAVIAGDGPLREELERETRQRALQDRVHWLGDVHNDDLRPFYAAADVFVLPSIARSEAFGIVQIEAMASGVPVVNTSLDSGVPEVSQDGITGLTVPPGDASALAKAINRLLSDPDLRGVLGRAGRKRALAEFSTVVMANRINELYLRLEARE
jgi:rhamnosyl/mannosyltransferase